MAATLKSDFTIVCYGRGESEYALKAIYRLRKYIFSDVFKWEVEIAGDEEKDYYDGIEGVIHLCLYDDNERLVGYVRFLPTTGPYMLRDTFPMLLGAAPAPYAPTISESSRFCIDHRIIEPRQKGETVGRLLIAMSEFGLQRGLDRIVTVTDKTLRNILAKRQWPLSCYTEPVQMSVGEAVAGWLPISDQAHHTLCMSIAARGGELGKDRAPGCRGVSLSGQSLERFGDSGTL